MLNAFAFAMPGQYAVSRNSAPRVTRQEVEG